jgi:hypothetical protein
VEYMKLFPYSYHTFYGGVDEERPTGATDQRAPHFCLGATEFLDRPLLELDGNARVGIGMGR